MTLEFEWDPQKAAANLGVSAERRLLAVMFVDRDAVIRIVSARKATRHERRNYEEITQ